MKIAVLSDIHSNVFALEAVLADIKSRSVDLCVNLGDILYGPIAPKETYELLMQHELITISGNQDRQIVEATDVEISANSTLAFIYEDIDKQALQWLDSLPFDMQLTDQIYMCHGAPNNDLVYLLEDIASGHPTLREDEDIISLLSEQKSELILCGHTHTPRSVYTSTKQLIVNSGSVGLQAYYDDVPLPHSMQTGCPHACYALIERSQDGWQVEHIKLPYNHKRAAKLAEKRGRLDWVYALMRGRAGDFRA